MNLRPVVAEKVRTAATCRRNVKLGSKNSFIFAFLDGSSLCWSADFDCSNHQLSDRGQCYRQAVAAVVPDISAHVPRKLPNNKLGLWTLGTLTQDLANAEQRDGMTVPIDGAVQELAIHTGGGVVSPAQELIEIVPDDAELEIEAMALIKDLVFVEEGQEPTVKFRGVSVHAIWPA